MKNTENQEVTLQPDEALELALEVIEATGPGSYPVAEEQIKAAIQTAKELRDIQRELVEALELALEVIEATGPGSYSVAEKRIKAAIANAKEGAKWAAL